MKIILPMVVVALAPISVQALEWDPTGVVSVEAHGGLILPAPLTVSARDESDTEWMHPGAIFGLSVGYGFARSIGARMRFDTNFLSDDVLHGHLLVMGADIVTSFGDADSLLLRPFLGLAHGTMFGTSFFVPRLGIDVLMPLSDAENAPGFLVRASVDTAFGSESGFGLRYGPMLSLSVGLAFDFLATQER